jgi:hypothetical protein
MSGTELARQNKVTGLGCEVEALLRSHKASENQVLVDNMS